MTTPEFIEWLDGKMAEHDVGKLVPPNKVIAADLDNCLEAKVRSAVTERILREARLDDQVRTALAAIERPTAAVLTKGITKMFKRAPEREWRDHVETVAIKLLDEQQEV
jgi:hypothetical protein